MSNLSIFSSSFAKVISEIGNDTFASELIKMLKDIVPFDNAVIVQYQFGEKPQVLYNDLPPPDEKSHIESFVNGAFLLDPFYRAAVDSKVAGLHRLSELAPEGFKKTEYYRSYFKLTKIKDEIGYIVRFNNNGFLNISLGRLELAKRFKLSQVALLNSITPVSYTHLTLPTSGGLWVGGGGGS